MSNSQSTIGCGLKNNMHSYIVELGIGWWSNFKKCCLTTYDHILLMGSLLVKLENEIVGNIKSDTVLA